MEERGHDRQPFDEHAALEELERLRANIRDLRSRRTDVAVQFEQFVRSLKTTERPPDDDVAAPPPNPADIGPPPLEIAPDRNHPATAPPQPATAAVRPRITARGALIGGAALLLAASGAVTWTLRKAPREPSPPDSSASAPVREPAPQVPPPVPSPRPTSSPSQSEIVTSGAAWVRVLADGEQVLERELPPGARVPVTAAKTLTIRTGNAGAVRVFIGGKDQGTLGAEGAVVTRTFNVPGR